MNKKGKILKQQAIVSNKKLSKYTKNNQYPTGF